MKPIIIFVSCLFLLIEVYGQQESKEFFLKKSKNQKTTAWILLGTGVTAIITGVIIDNSHESENQSFTGGFIEVGGIICTLASVPFFIGSAKNKKRAVTLTLNNRKILLPLNELLTHKIQPTLTVRVLLSRD